MTGIINEFEEIDGHTKKRKEPCTKYVGKPFTSSKRLGPERCLKFLQIMNVMISIVTIPKSKVRF